MSLAGLGNHAVGGLENRLGAAVVLLEWHDGGAGMLFGEIEDVADGGCPERVNRLGVVSNGRQPHAVGAESLQQAALQPVGVLVFVNQHAVEQFSHCWSGTGVVQQRFPEDQQVVEVQAVLNLLTIHVRSEQFAQPVEILGTPGEGVLDHLSEACLRVDDPAVDGRAGSLLGKPSTRFSQSQFISQRGHQIFGVPPVEDREFRWQFDHPPETSQQPSGDRVERAAPDPCGPRGGPSAATLELSQDRFDPS